MNWYSTCHSAVDNDDISTAKLFVEKKVQGKVLFLQGFYCCSVEVYLMETDSFYLKKKMYCRMRLCRMHKTSARICWRQKSYN